MKRLFIFLGILILLSGLFSGCDSHVPGYYPSIQDVTEESIMESLDPMFSLEKYGTYELVSKTPSSSEGAYDGYTVTIRCHKRDQFYLGNQYTEYDTGEFYRVFYSSEPADELMYIYSSDGCAGLELTQEKLHQLLGEDLLGISSFDLSISKRWKEKGYYKLRVNASRDGKVVEIHDLSIDPENGLIMADQIQYLSDGKATGNSEIAITYSKEIKIDKEPKYAFEHSGEKGSKMTFKTVNLDGQQVDLSSFSQSKVLMINFWEPWCDSCEEELPVLEALYEKYHDQGLEILGVYSSFTMDDKVHNMVKGAGVTYPILKWHASLQILATEYRPSTVFLSSDGTVLSEEPVLGSRSFDEWEEILKNYL